MSQVTTGATLLRVEVCFPEVHELPRGSVFQECSATVPEAVLLARLFDLAQGQAAGATFSSVSKSPVRRLLPSLRSSPRRDGCRCRREIAFQSASGTAPSRAVDAW